MVSPKHLDNNAMEGAECGHASDPHHAPLPAHTRPNRTTAAGLVAPLTIASSRRPQASSAVSLLRVVEVVVVDGRDVALGVVGDQGVDAYAGNTAVKLLPRPTSLSTRIAPPARVMMSCSVARPRPVPLPISLVVNRA